MRCTAQVFSKSSKELKLIQRNLSIKSQCQIINIAQIQNVSGLRQAETCHHKTSYPKMPARSFGKRSNSLRRPLQSR